MDYAILSNFSIEFLDNDLVMEYAEGNWIFEGSGPPGGIGEAVARKYFRDVVAGLSYLHNHVRQLVYMLSNFVQNIVST